MYRSFGFYYLLSFFLCSLLFLHVSRGHSESWQDIVNYAKTHSIVHKSLLPKEKHQLIEVLDAGDFPDLSREVFVGAKNHRGKNTSPNQEVNSMLSYPFSSKKGQKGEGSSFLDELASSKREQEKSPSHSFIPSGMKKELLNSQSHYFHGKSVRKLNIQMDQNGELSVNVIAFPGAEYLIRVAKIIFHYWMDFLPAQMIQMGFIKTDGLGSLQSILLLSSQDPHLDRYQVKFYKPFLSQTLNQRTLNAFTYFHMPMDDHVRIRSVGVEIKIYRDTLAVSANFEFQLWDPVSLPKSPS